MSGTDEFWEWFRGNKGLYETIHEADEQEVKKRVGLLGERLSGYCDDLAFEVGGGDGAYEIIISADGQLALFGEVIKLVKSAPQIEGWQVTAFRQPNIGMVQYQGLELDAADMSFLPMESDKTQNEFDLLVAIPGYDAARIKDYHFAMWILLDNLVGEFLVATEIYDLDLENKPLEQRQVGYLPLLELPDYLMALHKGKKQDS